MKNKIIIQGFSLIEILVVVAIIGILAAVVLVKVSQIRTKARINATKTSLRSVLPAVVACRDSGGVVSGPAAGADICSAGFGLSNSKWPELKYNYVYGGYIPATCSFSVSTNGDTATDLVCSCLTQICQ